MSEIKDFKTIKEIWTYLENGNHDFLVCIDSNVERLYEKELEHFKSKYKHKWFTFPAGEEAKSLLNWQKALEFFIENGVHRQSTLVAIGGGALSDVAGFVASTLLRGIQWMVVPTTILSQIDASIGGKVAVNSKHGKNLIGNFHQPKKVLITDEFLTTLDSNEVLSGYGELLKYAFIDKKISTLIENESPMLELMKECASVKQEIVTKDPTEQGIRKILNLGHTFGHVIEWKYKLSHGLSVIWGMAIIFTLFNQKDELNKLKKMVIQLKIEDSLVNPIHQGENAYDFFDLLVKDKKIISQKTIELIVVSENKDVISKEFDLTNLKELLSLKMREISEISFN